MVKIDKNSLILINFVVLRMRCYLKNLNKLAQVRGEFAGEYVLGVNRRFGLQ